MTQAHALSRSVLERAEYIQAEFRAGSRLKDFVVVPDFLSPEILKVMQNFAWEAPLKPFCVFSRSANGEVLETRFGSPEEELYYVSAHRRLPPDQRVPPAIDACMGSAATRAALAALTGVTVDSYGEPSTLTGWGPGDFLGEHCDYGTPERPTRLIVSVSLTGDWSSDYGGLTHFRWLGGDDEIVVAPRLNVATIFRAGHHSVHWVAPISITAPAGRRFTWTMHYY